MARGTYRLLDCGRGRKLELVGDVLMDRQAPAAFWEPELPPAEWEKARLVHHRSEAGGGHWERRGAAPESWEIEYGGLALKIKPTPFGHFGLFAEQRDQWAWLGAACKDAAEALGRAPEVLNLFAYTGGSSLACAAAGATVCHVDASKGAVDWARENAALNGLAERPIRWIVDDVVEFLKREEKRGRRYDGAIIDPPTFGRGAKGETWKIEEQILPLLARIRAVLAPAPSFVLFTCHSPGFGPIVLDRLASSLLPAPASRSSGELAVPAPDEARPLPAGAFARRASGVPSA